MIFLRQSLYLTFNHMHEYTSLLSKFPELTRVHNYHDNPVKHDVTYHITTSGPPVSCRARRLSPEKLTIARKEFEHMLD